MIKRDTKDRALVSVVATLRTAEQAGAVHARGRLRRKRRKLEWSSAPIPRRLNCKDIALNSRIWTSPAGIPQKSQKFTGMLTSLASLKLAKFWRGKWRITDAGIAELKGEKEWND